MKEMKRYSITLEEGAKAYGDELNISPKHAVEICAAIKGKKLEEAKKLLEDVIKKKQFIPFRKHKKQIPHRKGGQPGRYPVKAARQILKLLENAENNAEEMGLEGELVVAHASAQKGRTFERRAPKGRMRPSNIQTVNVEIILKGM